MYPVLARWLLAGLRVRRRLLVPVVVLVVASSMLLSFAWLAARDVAPSLDGRFGSADGRWGPLPADVATAVAARSDAHVASAVCWGQVTIGDGPAQLPAVWLDRSSPLVSTMLTNHAVSDLGTGTVAVSESAAERLSLGLGDAVMLGGRSHLVAAVAGDPDHVHDDVAVFGVLSDVTDSAACYVVGSSRSAIEPLVGSVAEVGGDTWWPRSNESPLVGYRLVFALGVVIIGSCVSSLLSAGLILLIDDLRYEVSVLVAVGTVTTALGRFIRSAIVATVLVGAAVGFLGAAMLELLARDRIADAFGVEGRGGVHSWSDPAVVLVIMAFLGVVTARWSTRDLAGDDTVQRIRGESEVPTAARRWRSATGWAAGAGPGLVIVGLALARLAGPTSGWTVVGAALMIGGALGSGPLAIAIVSGLLGRLGTEHWVAGQQVRVYARQILPLVLVGSTLVGLASGGVMGTEMVARQREAEPAVLANQVVVSSQNRWNEGTSLEVELWPTGGVGGPELATLRAAAGDGGSATTLLALVHAAADATPSSVDQLRWMSNLTSVGGVGVDETFIVDEVPLYVATDQLMAALGAGPIIDDDDLVQVHTGLVGNHNRIVGGPGPTPDIEVVRLPALITRVGPSAVVSEHDAALLGRPVEVGALVVVPEGENAPARLSAVSRAATDLGLYTVEPADAAALRSLREWILLFGALLAGAIGWVDGFLMTRLGRHTRMLLHRVGAPQRLQRRIDYAKAMVLIVASLVPAYLMGIAPGYLSSAVARPETSNLAGFAGIVAAMGLGAAAATWTERRSHSRLVRRL
ncbi:MAG: hypothetical protein KDB21_12940 [Acidimicrobiales bacterium]|nr:hypothetical protein [Acidimicrobiales bacterium]